MPNFKTHVTIGGGVGFAAYCAVHQLKKVVQPDKKFDWLEAAVWAGTAALAASLPDFLEPATSPNHRGFFHSILVLVALLWLLGRLGAGGVAMIGLFFVAGLGYVSHLAADALTPRCLPWIGR